LTALHVASAEVTSTVKLLSILIAPVLASLDIERTFFAITSDQVCEENHIQLPVLTKFSAGATGASEIKYLLEKMRTTQRVEIHRAYNVVKTEKATLTSATTGQKLSNDHEWIVANHDLQPSPEDPSYRCWFDGV